MARTLKQRSQDADRTSRTSTPRAAIHERVVIALAAIRALEAKLAALEATRDPDWGHAGDAANYSARLVDLAEPE